MLPLLSSSPPLIALPGLPPAIADDQRYTQNIPARRSHHSEVGPTTACTSRFYSEGPRHAGPGAARRADHARPSTKALQTRPQLVKWLSKARAAASYPGLRGKRASRSLPGANVPSFRLESSDLPSLQASP